MTDVLSRGRRRAFPVLLGAVLAAFLTVPGVAWADAPGGTDDDPGVPEPQLALVGPARDADPCPLIDTTVLRPFGDVRVMPSYLLSGCDARVDASSTRSRVAVAFEGPDDAGLPVGPTVPVGALRVVRGGLDSAYGEPRCDTVVLLPDGNRVRVSSSEISGGVGPLCRMTDLATVGVVDRLVDDGITYTPGRTDAFDLASAHACTLLDRTSLALVSGVDAGRVAPGFADWSCAWGTAEYGQPHVDLTLRLDDAEPAVYGRPFTVDGKSGWTDPGPGYYNRSRCTAYLEHQPAASPQDQTELVAVTVDSPGADSCPSAVALAVLADRRLPG